MIAWLTHPLKCVAMDKAFTFLRTADAERIREVSDEIIGRCQTEAERRAVCGTLTQVIDRVRPAGEQSCV